MPAFEALDWLHQGVVLVDRGGRVVFANDAARRILADRVGLRCEDGVLQADKPSDTSGLRRLIAGLNSSVWRKRRATTAAKIACDNVANKVSQPAAPAGRR